MSEDPVKYDPFQDEKYPGEPDTVRPEWEDQRIRIEALRAAAAITGRIYAAAAGHPDQSSSITGDQTAKDTLDIAKQFAAYLETGE